MKIRHTGREDKIELQMTPMIDIVFQLLIFFIMTFKIVSMEGDFNIKMPLNAPSQGAPQDDELPPMKLKLTADNTGTLSAITLNSNRQFATWDDLHLAIVEMIGTERGPNSKQATTEVELDCDYNLRYSHVVEAITAVSGYVDDGGNVVKLIEKIKFSPPDPGNAAS